MKIWWGPHCPGLFLGRLPISQTLCPVHGLTIETVKYEDEISIGLVCILLRRMPSSGMWRCENLKSYIVYYYYYYRYIIIMVVKMTPIKSLLSKGKICLLFIFVGGRVCFVYPFACDYIIVGLLAGELLKLY
jgi:hypothetical protein